MLNIVMFGIKSLGITTTKAIRKMDERVANAAN
jgi:hypothetical protein